MLSWRDPFLTFSAEAEVLPLLSAAEPAWVFSRDGSRVFWANPAGGALLGAPRFDLLAQRRWDAGHPLKRELETLSRSLPESGSLARLRLARDLHSVPLACRCRRLRAGEFRGLLIHAQGPGKPPSLEDIAGFLATAEGAVAIIGEDGTVAAQVGPGHADQFSGAAMQLRHSGRLYRLSFSHVIGATAAPSHAHELSVDIGIPSSVEQEPAPALNAPAAEPPAKIIPVEQTLPAEPAIDNAGLPIEAAVPAEAAGNFLHQSEAEPQARETEPSKENAASAGPGTADEGAGPSVMAGRVARELSRQPVRFLWQTDAADRFLFVSPGLAQVVGRNADVVGERWEELAARLRLDPGSRIIRAMADRDTWSGQTAWWPVEGSNVRVPAELTALPIFGGDHSFQGFRGFGVLKPAEALMPAGFEARFGTPDSGQRKAPEQVPPYEETAAPPAPAAPAANVVPIRADLERVADQTRLTPQEFNAFEEIAAALRHRILAPDVLGVPDEAEPGPQRGTAEAHPVNEERRPSDHEIRRPVVPLYRDRIEEHFSRPISPADNVAIPDDELVPAPPADTVPEPATLAELQPAAAPISMPAASGVDETGPEQREVDPEPEQHAPVDSAMSDAASAEDSAPDLPAPDHSAPPEPAPASIDGRAEAPPPPRPAMAEGDALRRLRELTAILDTATDGVIILDGEGVIESANASAEALFGLQSDELRNMEFGELLTPDSAKSALDYLSGLKHNGVASLLNEGREVVAPAGAGSIPLFMTLGRISDGDGGRFCAVLRDITHWKRTEAELVAARRAAEEASSQKSEFLARVSHEIRTPLNAIIGFAEVMIEERFGPVENERYREYLRDIRTSGEHVVSLVNDLLDISKIEAGKLDLNFVAVPLNDLVRESIAMMQPQAGRGRVVLRSSLSREVPGVVADQRTMRQIVLNILSNAIKFTGPGGQVIASTSLADSGEAVLRIRDTGEGMTEAELARALEPFRQIATATLSDRTGTGLGLPLTKALVEANRAGLAIRSARGEGTVVTITFPPTRVLSE